jgi:polyferredoxin
VPAWLEHGLGILPFVYLGAAVLFAATGSAFIICQYDPFIPIFRLSGRALMVLGGAALLLLAVFIGRPYCRFLCPYGALLKMCASAAKWRVRVTPNFCTQCRLCEISCPFGAMREPQMSSGADQLLRADRKRLALLVVFLPALLAACAWTGHLFSRPASRLHPTVSLADVLLRNEGKSRPTGALTPEEHALERARSNPQEILNAAASIEHKFATGGWFFGGWIGLVIGAKLISLSIRRQRTDYQPDRGSCVACARCFEYCPNELVRRGLSPALVTDSPAPQVSGFPSAEAGK